MITISINGRLLDAIYALVVSMAPEATPEAPVAGIKAVEDPSGHSRQVAAAKATEPVAAGKRRKKAAPREQVSVTRTEAPVEPIKTAPKPTKAYETQPEPIKATPEPINADETPLAPIKIDEAPAPKALAPVALDDEWPTTLTKPPEWDYDGQGASWRAANQIGTAELGAAIQRVYVDHADIIKMPSVRVAMSKLGVEGWWRCVAKNIAEARDASNKPLDITPKREAQK